MTCALRVCMYLVIRATGGISLAASGPVLVQQPAAVYVWFTYIQSSPYFDPAHTRTGWIGQPPVLDRHEVVTIDGDVVTLRQATP